MKSKRMCAAVLVLVTAGMQMTAFAENIDSEDNVAQIVAGNNGLGNAVMSELIQKEMEEESGRDNIFISKLGKFAICELFCCNKRKIVV